jgi:phospholipid-binding lipoprotein MlaA
MVFMPDQSIRGLRGVVCSIVLPVALLAGCSAASEGAGEDALYDEPYDPFEPINRYFFEINYALDELVLKPFAGWYKLMLPEFARDRVADALQNIRSP